MRTILRSLSRATLVLSLVLFADGAHANSADVPGLHREARELMKQGKRLEAIAVYSRLVAADPGNTSAHVEYGKVLYWTSKFVESETSFRKAIAQDPNHHEARLGLARVHTARRQYAKAHRVLDELLSKDPHDLDVLVAKGQAYQWSYENDRARDAFETVLAFEPDHKDARLGLGYLDLRADPRSVTAAARAVEPQNAGEARGLRQALAKWRGPSAAVSTLRQDANENELEISRLEGRVGLPGAMDLEVTATRFDATLGKQTGSVDSFQTKVGVPLGRGHLLNVRGGIDSVSPAVGRSFDQAIGGLTWAFGQGRRLQGQFSADRDTYRLTVDTLADKLVINAYAASASYRLGGGLVMDAQVSHHDISGRDASFDNSRKGLEAGIKRRGLIKGLVPIELGYAFQYYGYDKSYANQFFAPSDSKTHRLRVSSGGMLANGGLFVILEGGLNTYSQDGAVKFTLKNQGYLNGTIAGAYRLTSFARLEASVFRVKSSIGTNVEVTTKGAAVRIQVAPRGLF